MKMKYINKAETINSDIILTGCSAQGPSMTKGNDTFSPSDTDASSLSFPCLTRESSGKMNHYFSGYSGGSTNMTRMISQSGRSMVEMLGVLAIVGVLSIGGIMGYSYGMDKYRANETTNQIMLRVIDLMTQAGNGNETLTFAGWENEQTQYDFGTPEYTDDDLIVFDVGTNEKMPKRICEMVYDNMKDMAVQIDINAVRADSNDTCGDDNEMTFYFEGGIGATCDPACPEGQYCDNGICFKGGAPEGTIGYGPSPADGDCGQCKEVAYGGDKCVSAFGGSCTLDNGGVGLCRNGECYPTGCTTNDDCTEAGTYCASTNSSGYNRFASGEEGACVSLDFIKKEVDGQTYYVSNRPLSWWDTEYACQAIEKTIGKKIRLLEAKELVILPDGSEWGDDYRYSDNCSTTPLAKKLYNAGFNFSMWTSTDGDETGDKYRVALWGENRPYVYSEYKAHSERGLQGVCQVVK